MDPTTVIPNAPLAGGEQKLFERVPLHVGPILSLLISERRHHLQHFAGFLKYYSVPLMFLYFTYLFLRGTFGAICRLKIASKVC